MLSVLSLADVSVRTDQNRDCLQERSKHVIVYISTLVAAVSFFRGNGGGGRG